MVKGWCQLLLICHGKECHRSKENENKTLKDAIPSLTCSEEKADTRLLLHCKQIAETGNFSATVLKTPNTDEVVIAVHFQHEIVTPLTGCQKWWKYIDIQAICRKQGEEVCTPSQDVLHSADFVVKGIFSSF